MSAHTPGPWETRLDPHQAHKRRRMALVDTGGGRMAIDCTDSGATYSADCANARLIAAAPDLLEAMKEASEFWAHYSCINESAQDESAAEVTALLKKMDAAIAKAEGK